MINYIDAFLSIQKVKKDLKTMTFENAKEFEILGRALCGCNGVTILDDGGVMNGYGYTRRRSYSNADWRAIELIDESIRYLKK